MKFKWIITTLSTVMFAATTTHALDVDTQIARGGESPLARNPETKYYSLPFVNDINYGYGVPQHTQDIFYLKPIIPFHVTPQYDLISRSIIPTLYHQPSTVPGTAYINGYGDINETLFISPARYRRLVWGIGPTVTMPTASNKAIGSGKWSVGPEIALFAMPDHWVIGFLTSNVWSVAGDTQRAAVNQFSFQYFISYNFPKGWFLTSQPTIIANWHAPANQVWLVPVGGGGGKAIHFGNVGIAASMQAFSNIVRPAAQGPNWTLQAKIEVLFEDQQVIPV